jgi:hypothetical protein
MIEHLAGFQGDVLAFVYQGHVTKDDYDTVLVPAVTKALETQKRLRVYCEVKSDFSGLDAGAVWEDLKVGMGHLTRWSGLRSSRIWIGSNGRCGSLIS